MLRKHDSGQSFIELALVIPLLLMLIAGLVEVGFFIHSYLTLLDLTREAARFASLRDPFTLNAASGTLPDAACADAPLLHYYFDTACIILDTSFNPFVPLDTNLDDIAISVLTVSGNIVSNRWPADSDGVWSLSTASDGWGGSESWTKDCDGAVINTTPYFTNTEVQSMFQTGAPTNKGIVIVEVYYCYHHVLNLPILSDYVDNPLRMHAYSIMPAFEAIPTPTPIP
ncbi:MAG: pilus assembly protein [Anaerolineae bacterium]|nr:pilus assembly protein [Anaerolineae bacterium]